MALSSFKQDITECGIRSQWDSSAQHWRQDWLHNLPGLVQNKIAGSLVQEGGETFFLFSTISVSIHHNVLFIYLMSHFFQHEDTHRASADPHRWGWASPKIWQAHMGARWLPDCPSLQPPDKCHRKLNQASYTSTDLQTQPMTWSPSQDAQHLAMSRERLALSKSPCWRGHIASNQGKDGQWLQGKWTSLFQMSTSFTQKYPDRKHEVYVG